MSYHRDNKCTYDGSHPSISFHTWNVDRINFSVNDVQTWEQMELGSLSQKLIKRLIRVVSFATIFTWVFNQGA